MKSLSLFLLIALFSLSTSAQDILPPVLPWDGASRSLVVAKTHPWVTPSELMDLTETPNYKETMNWLEKLVAASPLLSMKSIGVSAQGRSIKMVIASTSKDHSAQALSQKPILLAQAGIHSGEIDGKDAGLMLLRDIAMGDKKNLLKKTNLLFVPILSVDGHERISPYNRVNQRGPTNMGWRTNANNLNLNRDYSKLETEGVQAIVNVINEYSPDLYLDLHVTDGADYQYDITYGWIGDQGYSPSISEWFANEYQPQLDQALSDQGHIPGPLMFAFNDLDFTEGNSEYAFSPRYSDSYGDVRHLPSILVENHSLKPYDQRVLGTYVLLEQTLKTLGEKGKALRTAIQQDQNSRKDSVVLEYTLSPLLLDSMHLLGIESIRKKSKITGKDYVTWTGKPVEEDIVVRRMNKPVMTVKVPQKYWIPAKCKGIIDKLKMHGIEMEVSAKEVNVQVEQYTIDEYTLATQQYEGRVRYNDVKLTSRSIKKTYPAGTYSISTDQPLGSLIVLLLEPQSPDGFLQWGYFNSIFSITEYIEDYVIEPLAAQMLEADQDLKKRFEEKMKSDSAFANSSYEIYQWFYAQSPYYDSAWKVYPVTREL